MSDQPEIGAPTAFLPALTAVYAGTLSRARAARAPLLFVASLQSIGLIVLMRAIVESKAKPEQAQLVAGATILVVAFVALNLLAQRIGALKGRGALDYYAAMPVPPAAVVLGLTCGYATFTLPGTVVTAGVGVLLYDLPIAHVWVLIPAVVLAGAALSGVGAVLGLLMPRPELATVAGQLGMTAVLFLDLVRAARLPLAVRVLRAGVPSTYAADALAAAFAKEPDFSVVAVDLAISAVIAVLALVAASRAWHRAVRP
ncbi:MAG: ABC transporter permease [Actinomycetota bacterium]